MKTYQCRNPKFCPFCRQKIKKEIIKFSSENPDMTYSPKLKQGVSLRDFYDALPYPKG